MIRINLLPTKAKEKARTLKNELIIAAVFVAVTIGLCIAVDKKKGGEVKDQMTTNRDLEIKINQYKQEIDEVAKFKAKKADLNAKLNAITELDTRRSGPVKMMDEFTQILPAKIWITSFKERNKRLDLEGMAMEGPIISDFLEKLRGSQYFTNAQLIQTSMTNYRGKKVQKFVIVVEVKYSV